MEAAFRGVPTQGGEHAVTQQTLPKRLYAGSGSSEAHEAAEAGSAAATEAIAGLDGRTPALIVVFASVRYHLPTLIAAIRAVTGTTPLVGETSSGHFRGGRLTEPATGVAVLAMTAGPYRFGVASVTALSEGGEAAGMELARSARAELDPERSPYATLMIFVDGLAAEQQALVGGIHHVTGAAVPVIGGAAADDRHLNETFVFHDDRILSDAAVAVWISSDQPVPVTVGHGWHPIGLPLLVTKVDGQIVHEIAGRPALDVFEEHIRQDNEHEQIRPGGYYSTHAFGLVEPDGTHLIRGVFMGDDGMIRTFAPLPVYSAIQIVACDEDDLLAMSHDVAQRSVTGRDAAVLLVFSCIARLDILQERGGEEATRLQAAAGQVPIFGVYTYGEFARTTSVAGYHNSTVAAVAL
jgi:hypothetical protein